MSYDRTFELIQIDEALHRLETFDQRQAKVVEMRFFGGLSVEETAVALGVSEPTVKREWAMAKAWLHRQIRAAYAMTSDRWRQIKQIFQAAVELPPEERSAYVQRACGGDGELRAEVESLLHSEEEEFFSGAAAAYVPEAFAEEDRDRNIGRRIGAYQIVPQIGEGGMGAVYLAERTGEFHQQAALKLLRAGMDSRGIVC